MLRPAKRTGKKAFVLTGQMAGSDELDDVDVIGTFEDDPTESEMREAISNWVLESMGLDETTASKDVMDGLDTDVDAYFDGTNGGWVQVVQVPVYSRKKR